jgi:tetratricopeptide (TPR) repeat protein
MWRLRLSRRGLPRLGFLQTVVPFLVLLTACPRRFDPRAQEVHGSSPVAEADFRSAEKLLAQGALAEGEKALAAFRSKYGPGEPLHPLATVHQAKALRQLSQAARAKGLLDPLLSAQATESWLSAEVRRELGLTEYQLGNWEVARRLLAPLSPQIVDGEEGAELHATLADLWKRADQHEAALREYERLAESKAVRPGELVYLKRQAALLCDRLPPAQHESCRKRFDVQPGEVAKTDRAQPLLIGLVLPMQGKDRVLGERVLRGALWAADLLGGPKQPSAKVELLLRDSSTGSLPALVADLAKEGAQVIVTPPTKAEATLASAEAEKLGLLALSLGPREVMTGGTLQLLRTNRSRGAGPGAAPDTQRSSDGGDLGAEQQLWTSDESRLCRRATGLDGEGGGRAVVCGPCDDVPVGSAAARQGPARGAVSAGVVVAARADLKPAGGSGRGRHLSRQPRSRWGSPADDQPSQAAPVTGRGHGRAAAALGGSLLARCGAGAAVGGLATGREQSGGAARLRQRGGADLARCAGL